MMTYVHIVIIPRDNNDDSQCVVIDGIMIIMEYIIMQRARMALN